MNFIVENVGDPLDQPRFRGYMRYLSSKLSTRKRLAVRFKFPTFKTFVELLSSFQYLEQVKDSGESMAAIRICMPELALRETPLLCEELAKKVIDDYQRGKSAENIVQEAQAVRFKFITPNIC